MTTSYYHKMVNYFEITSYIHQEKLHANLTTICIMFSISPSSACFLIICLQTLLNVMWYLIKIFTYMKILCVYIYTHAFGFHNRKWYHVWCNNYLVVSNMDLMKINSPWRCGLPITKQLSNLWVLQNVTWLSGQTRHYPNPHDQHVSPMKNFPHAKYIMHH
jgi:hypothetical protein